MNSDIAISSRVSSFSLQATGVSIACDLSSRVHSVAQDPMRAVNRSWAYVGKMIAVTKAGLNVAARRCVHCLRAGQSPDAKLLAIATRLKTISLVPAILNLFDIEQEGRSWKRAVSIGDSEGVAVKTMALSLLLLDTVDSAFTFVNASLTVLSMPSVQWIGAIGLPTGFALSSLTMVSRSIKVFQSGRFARDLNAELTKLQAASRSNDEGVFRQQLGAFLVTHLGVSAQELQKIIAAEEQRPGSSEDRIDAALSALRAVKRSMMERRVGAKVVGVLEELERLVETRQPLKPAQIDKILAQLNDAKASVHRKIGMDCFGFLGGLVLFVGLCLFLTPVAPVVPFALIGLAFTIRLAALAYDDFYPLVASTA